MEDGRSIVSIWMGINGLVPNSGVTVEYMADNIGFWGLDRRGEDPEKAETFYRVLGLRYYSTNMSTEEQTEYINNPNNDAVLLRMVRRDYQSGCEAFVLVMPSSDGHVYLFDPAQDTHGDIYNGDKDISEYSHFGGVTYVLELQSKEEWLEYKRSHQYWEDCATLGFNPVTTRDAVDELFGKPDRTPTAINREDEARIREQREEAERAQRWALEAEDLYLEGRISREEYEKARAEAERLNPMLYYRDDNNNQQDNSETDQQPSVAEKTFAEQVADYIDSSQHRGMTTTSTSTGEGGETSTITITQDLDDPDAMDLTMEVRDYVDDMISSGKTEVEYTTIIREDGTKVTVITFKEPPPPEDEEGEEEEDSSSSQPKDRMTGSQEERL